MSSPLSSPLSSTGSGKHTVYIDIDDEITAIIDKVKTSPDKIVALVLPKRATVLQSIVNMKLLKKSAQAAKKSLVLITSEVGLMPLAGAVGIHVAKSLQSRPEIPLPPDHENSDESEISEADEDVTNDLDKTKTVGALSAAALASQTDEMETIELDDIDVEDASVSEEIDSKKKSGKGFKVPNFDRFRLSLFLAILAVILLIGGWILAAIVLPKANVVIQTNTTTQVSTVNFTANTAIKDLNVDQALVPAVQKEIKKTDTEKATATGKKDNGTKATGKLTLSNCINDGASHTIPAGSGFSNGSLTYTTNESVTLDPALFSGPNCKSSTYGLNKDVGVTAVNGGANYNVPAASYSSSISGISAYGSEMAGGTSSIVTLITQADIDGAVSKMKGREDAAAATELAQNLQTDSLRGFDETKTISAPIITTSPAVGTEASDVTVTAITTYDILGVKVDYLNQLIKKDVSTKIDITKEGILDNGLGAAVIRVVTKKSPTEAQMSIRSIVVSGPTLNADAVKEQIKGKKRGDAINLIKAKPGIKDVQINYSPFWVLSTPKSTKKITVTIKKPVVKPAVERNTSNDSNP